MTLRDGVDARADARVDARADAHEPAGPALFTAEQMRAHGRLLAGRHRLGEQKPREQLLRRLRANEATLSAVGRMLALTLAGGRRVTPAGEWLLDNLYLIEQEVDTARRHLPRGYGRQLPRLAEDAADSDSAAGQPRVYALAMSAVSHSDGQLAVDTLAGFIAAYQERQPLSLGELWAFPIMLRLALIENLRRAAVAVSDAQHDRDQAEAWATRLLEVADQRPSDLVLVVADLARSDVRLSTAFVAELASRLQGRGAALTMPLSWIEQRLADEEQTIEALFRNDSRLQANWQLTVANSIGSLRRISATDWGTFVEAASGVERKLREDPAGVYPRTDFASRDACRHAVERFARLSRRSEAEIAAQVVDLAAAADLRPPPSATVDGALDRREAHVGHYLLGRGRATLARTLGLRAPLAPAQALRLYLAAVVALTAVLGGGAAWQFTRQAGAGDELPAWVWVMLVPALAIAASQLALGLVNWGATLLVPPLLLPRLDFAKGIAADASTLVVVPTLLAGIDSVGELADRLEVHHLANRDAQLRFALLSDLCDAAHEHEPGDEALVERAAARIAELNARHPRAAGDTFFLFHRPRRWNEREGLWMGHERKRGKLSDLNALLRGRAGVGPDEPFARIEGDTRDLQGVRYVITLDSDTELPHGSAAQMVATMAHPLQRPRSGRGAQAGVVVEGHAILQPRTAANLPSTLRSRLARLYGSGAGIDPYTRAVSDVYQDLFDEGSYIGKGIYDVDAFERALAGRLAPGRVLSHDLIEGCHARAGLLSDVTLVEQAPLRHANEASRLHRWTRGDWQLLPWLLPRIKVLPGAPPNPLSALSRWKLLDNLRRSLVAPSLLALLLLGWTVLPAPAAWTLVVVAVLGLVPLLMQLGGLLRRWLPASVEHPAADSPPAAPALQLLHRLLLLPDDARLMLDAIVRTLWRLAISHRRLLEWTASAQLPVGAAPGSVSALKAGFRSAPAGPLLAVAMLLLLAWLRPQAVAVAAPVLALWALAPLLVFWLDQRPQLRTAPLSRVDRALLRGVARRTWAFFEDYVGAEDNHLPPDNVQQQPTPRTAHRTSPTNIGFAMLASLAARDLGYLAPSRVLSRIEGTLETLGRLERHRGHFYNWYDTQTLAPLLPRYVSTVDSGNLQAALLVVRAGLLEMADEPLFTHVWCDGVRDTLVLLRAADTAGAAQQSSARMAERVGGFCERPPATLATLQSTLEALHLGAADVLAAVAGNAASADLREMNGEPLLWARTLTRQCRMAVEEMAALVPEALIAATDAATPIPSLRELALHPEATPAARAVLQRLEEAAARLLEMTEMDYDFLFDEARKLLAIGWHVDDQRRDAGSYDLLASEARLGVFVAIAQGQLPPQAWFALGRGLSSVHGQPVLLSWSGSMFEYLMPALLMPQWPGTLLAQSCHAAVRRHIDYGAERGVPWGISEAGYNATDSALNYQYRAFGVPGLGLKRGLGDELVVAPYATMIALLVEPARAAANLRRLAEFDAYGSHGFFEAIDFTPGRLPPGQAHAVVRSFMAHHQGMALLALTQVLAGARMQRRFEADPALRAALPLLHEKAPSGPVPTAGSADRAALLVPESTVDVGDERSFATPQTRQPEVQLLSNGRYHVLLTQAGGGASSWRNLALTRWREDTTRDAWGSFCYLRDLDTGHVWSTTHQPTLAKPLRSTTVFSESRVEYTRLDNTIEARTTIAVSPEDDVELRRLRLRNAGRSRRRIELTSYAEVALASAAEDSQHPAFAKLFVQTELLPALGALLCHRRPRSAGEKTPWMFHLLVVHGLDARSSWLLEISAETDRARFIGRGRTTADPLALAEPGPLSNTAGAVLDPVAASRCVLSIDAERSRVVDLVTGIADSREGCLALIDKYRDRRLADRVFELAWTHAQVLLRQLEISAAEAQLFARVAGMLIFAQRSLRADDSLIRQNRRGQAGLWGYSISGDLPIVLVTIADARRIELVRQLVLAHSWWRQKGLAVDLVIWNEEHDTYRQRLHEQILGLVAARREANAVDPPGGIFVRHADQIAPEDRVLLMSVARVVFSDQRGSLAEQLQRGAMAERRRAPLDGQRADAERRRQPLRPSAGPRAEAPLPAPSWPLQLANGFGGYTDGARQYVVAPPAGTPTPAPWSNVLANPRLGCVISESGGAYSWFGNAHEFRLTPWHNDPVSDTSGEAMYLRDEDTGEVWSPTSLPAGAAPAPARHGFGRSVFEQRAHGIHSELTVFVALDAPVRFAVLRASNESDEVRRISMTGYVEWVLGSQRSRSAPHTVCEVAPDSGALLARNAFGQEHAARVAFFDIDAEHIGPASFTCDRRDFIGRHGSLRDPLALRETRLSGRSGPALDPCAAFQVPLQLAPGASRTVVFRLGAGDDASEATALIARFRAPDAWQQALAAVDEHWHGLLGALQVSTPEPALDALANGWLLYQVVACRLWARSGYYQSGGAYGYRDQLQDTMALVHSRPELLREQLLRCAGRQFPEGDVQHWWHPPGGRGVRTFCSDDYLWLPLALVRYWRCTADAALLAERLPFIEGRAPAAGEEAVFDLPQPSSESATVYEHARRAIVHGLRFGEHGLPLIGTGDWNDGMNRVGHHGRGESVWLAFFLCRVLADFAPLARAQGDAGFAERCDTERTALAERIEEHAWDGLWYRRGWFDDGLPLGSSTSAECRIDLIAQSWAVLSGAALPERATLALDSMQAQLVDTENGIVRLLDPPFNGAGPDPGYIAGYVPGVRENGGQYTHGAIWAAMALAEAGAVEDAWRLFAMVNPVNHARNADEVQRYKVEPYVVTADVYGVAPHIGRGGWSWYTGSAGWLYRLVIETLLGITLENDGGRAWLVLAPRLPAAWPGFSFSYRRGASTWQVEVQRGSATGLQVDERLLPDTRLPLDDDGRGHHAVLTWAD